AVFAPAADHPAMALLADQGLEGGEELVLRRQVGSDGRSRAFVNDQPVSVGLLRRLADTLVEIEGQFEQQGLKDPATHRAWLDAYGALGTRAARVQEAWRHWRAQRAAREAGEAELERAQREEDWLRHAAGELRQLDPQAGEEEALAAERVRLMSREQILEALGAAYSELAGDSGAERRVSAALRRLDRIAEKAGEAVRPIREGLERAAAELG